MTIAKEIQGLLETLQKQSVEVFKNMGHIMPMFFVACENGQLLIVPADFSSHDAKSMTCLAVRRIAAAQKAAAVGLVTEAWSLANHAGKTLDEALKDCGTVSKHPDKTEVIQIILSTPDYDLATQAEIIRAKAGDYKSMGCVTSWSKPDPNLKSEGLLSNFFTGNTAMEIEMNMLGQLDALRAVAVTDADKARLKELETEIENLAGAAPSIAVTYVTQEMLKEKLAAVVKPVDSKYKN